MNSKEFVTHDPSVADYRDTSPTSLGRNFGVKPFPLRMEPRI